MTPTTVYLARDNAGTVLYVGCTYAHRFPERMREHRYWSGWYSDAETIERREYADRATGERAEWVLIAQHPNRYNRPFGGAADPAALTAPDPLSVDTVPPPRPGRLVRFTDDDEAQILRLTASGASTATTDGISPRTAARLAAVQ